MHHSDNTKLHITKFTTCSLSFGKKTSVDFAIPLERIARLYSALFKSTASLPKCGTGVQGAPSVHITHHFFYARNYESTSSVSDTYHLADCVIINTLYIIMKLLTKHNRKCIADRLLSWMFGHYLGFYLYCPYHT